MLARREPSTFIATMYKYSFTYDQTERIHAPLKSKQNASLSLKLITIAAKYKFCDNCRFSGPISLTLHVNPLPADVSLEISNFIWLFKN